MKKITLFLTMLLLCTSAMAQDYSTHYDGQTKSTRFINYVSLQSPSCGESKLELNTSENASLYVDRTSDITFRCRVGEKVTPNTGYIDGWMHTFVYLDQDKNGFVVSDVNAEDLVSFAYYNGKNSLGNTVADNVVAAPAFVAPETPGTYRLRFKIDWNDLDPGGSLVEGNTMKKNNGGIIDVMLEVIEVPLHSITYNYKNDGVLVGSITHNVLEGSSFPDLVSGLYGVTVNSTKPDGTVSKDGEYDIAVTLGEFPFEYAKTYDAIGNKWYNLIMHSNWNTGDGTEKYRTYVGAGADNATTLEWGTKRSLSNATDDYYWAFVGDPINGFRIVNKAKGEDFVLSSNGTQNPLLKEESTLQDGYNTTWQLAARKYNVGQKGDYILEGAWFCLKHTNGEYINANARNGNVAFWSDNDNGSAILAVKPITINPAADYSTYYSDNYIKIPQTVAEVYYVNSIESSCAKLEQIEGESFCMQNGVIIKKEVDATFTYAPEITATIASIEGNLLKGTTKRTLITKESNKAYYVLGMNEGIGFYNAVNGKNEGEFYNDAFKAYLEVPTPQGVNMLRFDFSGETTGVEEVEVESTVKTIYDLSGRKVSSMSAPGLYIVNGKKVLVK